MSFLLRTILALSLCGVSQAQQPVSDAAGTIEGVVLDAHGVAVSDAKVFDQPMDSARIGKDHYAVTDSHGHFVLADVPPGKVLVIATKTEAGYPDGRFAPFSGNEVSPVVVVHPNRVTSEVVVKLLEKGGLIRGRIVDNETKRPIPGARITLGRVDHPKWTLETDPANDGTFEFVVPSRPMHVTVTAEGFRTWTYEESNLSKNHAPLLVAPEAKQNLDIYLDRKK